MRIEAQSRGCRPVAAAVVSVAVKTIRNGPARPAIYVQSGPRLTFNPPPANDNSSDGPAPERDARTH